MSKYPNKTHYSKNFRRTELRCRCGCRTPPLVNKRLVFLAARLEKLRRVLGNKPLGVLSAYRCPAYNKKIGGASQSQHMLGRAADLKVPRGQQKRYVRAARRVTLFRKGGIGVYPNGGVHVDFRPWVARWDSWTRK